MRERGGGIFDGKGGGLGSREGVWEKVGTTLEAVH